MLSTKSVRNLLGLLIATLVLAGLSLQPAVLALPRVQDDEPVTLRVWD
jgi:hypothetical protein